MKTIKKFLRVDRREICYLKFILEAYDGIATLTTIDAHQGIVMLRIAPGCEGDVEAVLQDLKKDIIIDDSEKYHL
ncbi:MAG TPA: DUF4911 domain-containing protein [Desulfobacteraceae bacterium]|nr:DUF4911 domain-containing protein [Desulfobacteraceae bacterium]